MPATRKPKGKARKSREAYMLSDIENVDIRPGQAAITLKSKEANLAIRSEDPKSLVTLLW